MKPDPQAESFSSRDPHSAALRIWHWSSSLAIMALLSTVLIASTLLKPRNTMGVIQAKLAEKGLTAGADQVKNAARGISKQVWVWHKYIGVALALLFLFRIILEFFQKNGQSLRARIRKGAFYLREIEPGKKEARHYLFVKYIYVFFYLLLFTIVLTGTGIIYADDFSFLKDVKENLKDLHSACMYGVMAFIVLHIGGVLLSELGKEPGITSDMINGGKKVKP